MSYVIRTKEFHQEQIDRCNANHSRRHAQQLDVMDCGLSSWGDDSMRSFHNNAIAMLEMGEELGIDGPAAERWFLIDNSGDEPRTMDAKIIDGQYGPVWILGDDEAEKFGRKFVPEGEKSRIQKQLNMKEEQRLSPCLRVMKSVCAGMGMPVSFYPMFGASNGAGN